MDAHSPSIAEAARRLLREEGSVLHLPLQLEQAGHDLALQISDALPKMLREPKVRCDAEWKYICIYVAGRLSVRIGGPEPSLETCWVPGEQAESWPRFVATAIDLLAAGYPGCIGCAGPAAEGEWQEQARRAEMKAAE
jgi:hypothetical protein